MENYSAEELRTIEIARNIIAEKTKAPGDAFASPTASAAYLKLYYAELDPEREHFSIMFLNSQHALIACESLFSGTVDGAAVYPREIVKRALAHNAAALILAHNHPSGVTEPSTADRRITERIKSGCDLMDLRVLDHFIIGGDNHYSFAEHGLI